jgi:hypothetical protein
MRTLVLALVALILAGPTAPRADQEKSANFVLPGCQAFLDAHTTDYALAGFCAGMVTGVSVMALLDGHACIPSSSTNAQLVRIVIRYVEAHPERMHEPFAVLALQALRAAWPGPCRQ